MPQVTVYIRKEDIAKWKALTKKSEFIHNALNGVGDFEKYVLDVVDKNLGGDLKGLDPIVKPIKTLPIKPTGPASEFEHFLKQKQGKK